MLVSLAGLGSYLPSSRIVIPDQPSGADGRARRRTGRASGPVVAGHRPIGRSCGSSCARSRTRRAIGLAHAGAAAVLRPRGERAGRLDRHHRRGAIGGRRGRLHRRAAARPASRRGDDAAAVDAGAALAPAALSVIDWLPAVAAIAFVSGVAGAGVQLAMFDQFMRRVPHGARGHVQLGRPERAERRPRGRPEHRAVLITAIGVRPSLLITAMVGLIAVALFAVESRGALRPAERATVALAQRIEEAPTAAAD